MNTRGSAANANTASNVDAPKTKIKCYFVINATEATTFIVLAFGKFPMVCVRKRWRGGPISWRQNALIISSCSSGQWHCAVCTVCTMCGARRPEGHNNPNLTPQQKQKLLAVAKWTHEYQLNPVTNAREHSSMLCTSCVAIKHSAAKNVYFN